MMFLDSLPQNEVMGKRLSNILMRHPFHRDGGKVAQFVKQCGGLDHNSTYHYLIQCTHFRSTCLIAEDERQHIVGFVSGHRPPERPDTLFIWQIATSPSMRGKGLASQMLDELWTLWKGLHFVEATVTPSNTPSQKLFKSFAVRHQAPLDIRKGFDGSDFEPYEHEKEQVFRIGPIG